MEYRSNVSWYLIKYLEDPRRGEPRNVGVLLRYGDRWYSHFVGEKDDGSIDGRNIRRFNLDGEVYRTWVDYYRRKTAGNRWEDVERSQRQHPGNFYVELGGHEYEATEPRALIRELYNQLVGFPPARVQQGNTVLEAAEDVLTRARISFDTDVSVPARWTDEGRLTEVRFPLRHVNGQMHLMDTIKSSRKADVNVRDLYARMTAARKAGSARSFVVFYSQSEAASIGQLENLLLPLEDTAETVDVDDPEKATDTVLAVIRRGSHGLFHA